MTDKQIKIVMVLFAVTLSGIAAYIMGKDDIVGAVPFIAMAVIGVICITWACWPREEAE